MITERLDQHPDPEYSDEFQYDGTGAHTCIRRLWCDGYGTLWVESVGGERVAIPGQIRALVAKRVAGARFK